MRLSPCVCVVFVLAASCAPVGITPGSEAVGRWAPFYSRNFQAERLDYFYDQSRVHRSSGHVIARWKVVGSPAAKTTLYVVDISCRDRTFTEKGTVIVDAEGRVSELPQSDLFVDRRIESGTSSDVFRREFCRA
jgi:hypothetical protein